MCYILIINELRLDFQLFRGLNRVVEREWEGDRHLLGHYYGFSGEIIANS